MENDVLYMGGEADDDVLRMTIINLKVIFHQLLRSYYGLDAHYPTTMNTRDEFRNVSVTEADAARKADLNWKLNK